MDKNITETRVELENHSYDIKIGHNLLKNAGELLSSIIKNRRIFIVSDEKVAPKYLETLETTLEANNFEYASFIVPQGEKTKSFFWLERLCETILTGRIDRSSVIIALGGGVIGDLTGFTASIMLRGVDFIQLPTTLLSQVDSSVGGKTAINMEYGKNLIGTFYQPKMVIIDTSTLKTLDERQIRSGYAEMVKYGLIQDVEFWNYLQKNGSDVIQLKEDVLKQTILRSCQIKAEIVSKDEKENNIRALLNFGHSFGHALEALTEFDAEKLLHGEAVAIGMLMATKLSENLGLIKKDVFNEVKKHFENVKLLTKLSDIKGLNKVSSNQIASLMERDKKNKNGKINLVLLKEKGQAFVYEDASSEDITNAIDFFI